MFFSAICKGGVSIMIRKITCFVLIILMLTLTPLSSFFAVQEVYASTSILDSQMFDHMLVPTLISAGLYFAWPDDINTSYEHVNRVKESLKDYLSSIQNDPVDPQEPEGPKWKDIFKKVLTGTVVFSAGTQLVYNTVKISEEFWQLIKSWVDDNFDEGVNEIITDEIDNGPVQYIVDAGNEFNVATVIENNILRFNGNINEQGNYYFYVNGHINTYGSLGNRPGHTWRIEFYKYGLSFYLDDDIIGDHFNAQSIYLITNSIPIETLDTIYGTPDIVDNSNYGWNNKYTDQKTIPIPIQINTDGTPKKDENGFYLPSIGVEEWIGVTPEEIPNLNPSGIPNPDIPDMPIIEDPDEQTGIMIYIGNILQLIVGQLSKLVEGVATLVSNTNQMIFGTPNPTFDPITGEQIDPETGLPVQPEPEPAVDDGIIGDGIDTNIPTDFEWGDFKHFLDIFFIFIYFIVILILILLKFLNIAFVGLVDISPNTELFDNYPTILEGINYIKNLKVGGLTITVQQAFEFVFMIFFYIFVIKQIRKLYNAAVNEDYRDYKENSRDMKLDYYEQNRHYGFSNYKSTYGNINHDNLRYRGSSGSNDVISDAYKNPSDYKNIKVTDYTEE